MVNREYFIKKNEQVSPNKLQADKSIPDESWIEHNKGEILVCQDAFLLYKEGILLAERLNFPVKNSFFPIGGGMINGSFEEGSLRKIVKEVSNLEITNIQNIGFVKILFERDLFDKNKKRDIFSKVYYAEAEGELKLDKFHNEHKIIPITDCKKYDSPIDNTLFNNLHPYVQDFLQIACQRAMGL